MTMTKGTGRRRRRPTVPAAAGATCPATGRPSATAVDQARRDMLRDVKPRKRTRIGADVVCEALIRQGVDVFFSYPGGVILPLYDVLG